MPYDIDTGYFGGGMKESKESDIKAKDKQIAKNVREGVQSTFKKPGTDYGKVLKSWMGLSDPEQEAAIKRRRSYIKD